MNWKPSNRGPAVARNGMVASEHPLATLAGVDVLRDGGNAFDAALAVSAVLPVVKPGRSHLGGDAYILTYTAADRRVTAVCSGGKAPTGATLERYAAGMPRHGGAAVAVPGLVDAWQAVHDRWCTMPLRRLLQPAAGYARDGFGVTRELELVVRGASGLFAKYAGLAALLHIDGKPPRMGQVLRQPALARTIEAIADGGRAAFYEGTSGRQIADAVQAAGGYMDAHDLASHGADVLEPLFVEYRGATVYETPPNSQGLILLEELNILEGYDVAGWGHLSADAIHHMVEAKKVAFEDRQRHAGDPAFTDFDPRMLLTKEHASERRRAIDPARAAASTTVAASSDTTSFVVVDAQGNACSFIQSVFAPFGAAVAVEALGIIMNNRMAGFSIEPGHPNVLAPGKRTMHTLNTYLVLRDGRLSIAGNTPGADFQVQTNLQVLTGMIDYALDPQAAIDAPRWGHTPEALLIEDEVPDETVAELERRGHVISRQRRELAPMGRAQAIAVDPQSGVLIGGSDARGEGLAAGW